MKVQRLIEKYKKLEGVWDAEGAELARQIFLQDLEQLDELPSGHAEEAPRYVKNILARLRELPLHDREVWLKAIMSEFERDFSHAIWREGYGQGKFEGMLEREKVKIPQMVADWIDYCKENHLTITGAFDPVSEHGIGLAGTFKGNVYKCTRWALDNQNLFARAWVDGYEVEKERRYEVRLKNIDDYLVKTSNNEYHFYHNIFTQSRTHTRKELEEAGFGWVFDCEGVEVEEV